MKVHLASRGCKLNQAEMDDLARALGTGGCLVSGASGADVIVFNSCAVTAEAERKSRQAIRRLRAANPRARLVVTGCYADLWPDAARQCGPDLILGNETKPHLAALLASWAAASPRETVHPPRRRTRAFVRIQDGCDNACSYCIVHVARGPSRSRLPQEIADDVRARAGEGYLEVVLTGVNIGAYGRDLGGPSLGDLTALILETTGLQRLRWSSVEPWDLNPGWFALWEDERLCRHLHLPLQSGCDATLPRMGRHYSAAEYTGLVTAARAAIPDLAVTTDIIVGFPGETDIDYEATERFVHEMRFARVHVFPFSPREGTPAADLAGQVGAHTVRARAASLRSIAAEMGREYRSRFIGRAMDVLWESRRGDTFAGLTSNYLRVEASAAPDLWNRIVPAKIEGLCFRGLRGTVLSSPPQG